MVRIKSMVMGHGSVVSIWSQDVFQVGVC